MNYYNEHDPKAAAWLRELIAQGHLPPGFVDSRDIQLVQPADLVGYTQCHFFAGIGGWSLALQLAGVPTTTRLWTGSCPCQPFSVAGKGLGKTDPRHLWPQFRRLIRLCRPPVVFGEQVASAAGRIWLSGVCADLEALAYRTAAADLCAAGGAEDCEIGLLRGDTALTWERATLSAPHLRQRLWWCAGRLALTGSQSARRQLRRSRKGPGETEQRSPDQFGGSGGLGGMDNSTSPRFHRPESDAEGFARQETRLQMSSSGCAGSNPAGGLGDPGSTGAGGNAGATLGPESSLRSEGYPDGLHRCDLTQPPSTTHGLEITSSGRLQDENQQPGDGRQTAGIGQADQFGIGSPWSHFDLIPCRDGKARRIESGTFPLVDGLPGRVGLLRGYGNAIVPQRAADFIQAALEALQET